MPETKDLNERIERIESGLAMAYTLACDVPITANSRETLGKASIALAELRRQATADASPVPDSEPEAPMDRAELIERLKAAKPHGNFGSDLCARDAKAAADLIEELLAALATPAPPAMAEGGDQALWVTVDMIVTVAGDFMQDPGEPLWRIAIDGYCADFDYSEAANNFALAINRRISAALSASPVPEVGAHHCSICGGSTFAAVDVQQFDGTYAPGPERRCIECKTTFTAQAFAKLNRSGGEG